MRVPLVALILIAGVTSAAADIRVDVSRYEGGKLIVEGTTAPGATVTLDGKYKTKSDGDGNFKFTEPYKPKYCMSDIRSGTDVYSAVIAGCLDPGFSGEIVPMKEAR